MNVSLSDPALFHEGLHYLSRKDQTLSKVIEAAQPDPPRRRLLDFEAIVRVIVNQQLSGKAAETIMNRVRVLCNGQVTVEIFDILPDQKIRECGISKSKVSFMRNACHFLTIEPHFLEKIQSMDGEDAFKRLQSLRGVGNWSASIILLFYAQHPDIFPVGDATLNKAIFQLYGSSKPEEVALRWAPHRSIASICLWNWVDRGQPR